MGKGQALVPFEERVERDKKFPSLIEDKLVLYHEPAGEEEYEFPPGLPCHPVLPVSGTGSYGPGLPAQTMLQVVRQSGTYRQGLSCLSSPAASPLRQLQGESSYLGWFLLSASRGSCQGQTGLPNPPLPLCRGPCTPPIEPPTR